MIAIGDILQNLSRQRGRGDNGPLLATRLFEARAGSRISHLSINQRLERAWIELTGAPFRHHHALALSALRRGEPFALVGGGPTTRQTAQLLLCELLGGEPESTVLILCPDAMTAALYRHEFDQLSRALDESPGVAVVGGEEARTAPGARILLVTPEALHGRLLQHHERAWRRFWQRLQLVLITDLEYYQGVAAAHLAALLLRTRRLLDPNGPFLLAATTVEMSGTAEGLAAISGHAWRIIAVDDGPHEQLTLAFWRGGADRLRESAIVALHLRREGLSVHIHCDGVEAPLVAPLVDADTGAISVGPLAVPAQALVFAGFPLSTAMLQRALASGARAVVIILGESPLERTLVRLIGQGGEGVPGLGDQPPAWIMTPANVYVLAQHLLCAANERPLDGEDRHTWNAGAIIERLEQHGQLARLPEHALLWQPRPVAEYDPYAGFALRGAGCDAATLVDERGILIEQLDPAAYDRWGFIGASLPPGRGGYRVVDRDEAGASLTIRPDPGGRRTFPLRRCQVQLRDERERRSLRGQTIGLGRVLVEEELYGYREVVAGSAPGERALPAPLLTSWSAPALWIDLPGEIQAPGQLIGWSLAAALPLRAVARLTDLVPVYDRHEQRIYLIDAQPGGNGVAAWLYQNLEQLLPLAYDIALDCRNDPLLEPLARADMDWLLALLGGRAAIVEPLPAPGRPGPAPLRPAEPAPPRVDRPSEPPARPVEPPAREAQPLQPAEAERQMELRSPPAPPAQSPPLVAGNESRAARRRRSGAPPRQAAQDQSRPPAKPPAREPPRTEAGPPVRRPAPPERPVRGGKAQPPAVETPSSPAVEPQPDAAAMVARIRRMRAEVEGRDPTPQAPARQSGAGPVEPRFAGGDRIFCLPYGEGLVRVSRIANGKELLMVVFPDYGELVIDPSVSAVRKIGEA